MMMKAIAATHFQGSTSRLPDSTHLRTNDLLEGILFPLNSRFRLGAPGHQSGFERQRVRADPLIVRQRSH